MQHTSDQQNATGSDSKSGPKAGPIIEEICLEDICLDGVALGSGSVGGASAGGGSAATTTRYTTVGHLIAARHKMLCDCFDAHEYSKEWHAAQEAELEAQEKSWRKFVLQRAIPKSDWALFRELRDHIRRQLTYTEQFGSFKSHVENVMPAFDEKKEPAKRRELAVRLQSVKLMDKGSIPTSVKVAVKLLAMQNNSALNTSSAAGAVFSSQNVSGAPAIGLENSSDEVKALAEQLGRNWKKRLALVASLGEYVEQTQQQSAIDWSNVESMLNIVGRQWKAIGPVARHRDYEALEAEFDASFDLLRSQLEAKYDSNAIEARQLLDLSCKLRVQPASSESLESALILHRRLDQVGLLRRADQEDILARIKRNISSVVTTRKQQLQSMHQWRALRAQALEIIKLLDRSGRLFGDELLNSYAEVEPQLEQFAELLQQLEEQFEPIHRGASPQALNAVFLHKQAIYMRKLDKESKELRLESLEAYNEASRLIGNVEQALLDSDQKLADESFAMAADYMLYVRNWPSNGEQILIARLDALKPSITPQ